MALGSAASTAAQDHHAHTVPHPLALQGVDSIVSFAQSLIGVPYRYGGCTPDGFDCSGLVSYVFMQFGMALPRTSIQLAEAGTEVPLDEACKGDIIIFAGRDPAKRPIGHAGIIVSDPGEPLKFIHSATSGRIGVIESLLERYDYFSGRFVKLVRVIEE